MPFEFSPFIYINVITQDSTGYIWLHAISGKMIRTDGSQLKEFSYDIDYRRLVSDVSVRGDLLPDGPNMIWIACARGIILFNTEKYDFKYFGEDEFGLSDYRYGIAQLTQLDANTILAFGSNSIYEIKYVRDIDGVDIKGFKEVASFDETEITETFIRDNKIYALGIQGGIVVNIPTYAVTPATQSDLELSTIYRLRESTGIMGNLVNRVGNYVPEDFPEMQDYYTDNNGVSWVCAKGNVIYKVVPDNNFIKIIGAREPTDYWSMFYRSNAFLWDNGFYYQLSDKKINVFGQDGNIQGEISLRSSGIDFTIKDRLIWVVDSLGLYCLPIYDGKTTGPVGSNLAKNFDKIGLQKIWKGKDNDFWLLGNDLTLYRSALGGVDTGLSVYRDLIGYESSFSTNWIELEDFGGSTMAISLSSGLYIYDKNRDEFMEFGSVFPIPSLSDHIITSYCWENGEHWFGTESGIWRYNEGGGELIRCPKLGNEIIFSLVADNSGRIWGTTANNLFMIEPVGGLFNIYLNTGEEETFIFQGGELLENGEIVFLQNNGLAYIVKPDKLDPQKKLNKLAITDVIINNIGLHEWLKSHDISKRNQLTLRHNENSIEFGFAGLEYFDQENIKYEYRLDGFDSDWKLVEDQNLEAYYPNLPNHRYTFRVRGSYGDLDTDSTETSFPFTITPPWWKSKAMFLFYFLLLFGAITAFWRYTIEKVRLREKIKLGEEKLKYEKELTEFKLDFFTDISHEFKTPLTIISGYINRLSDNRIPDKKREEAYSTMKRNVERLMVLVSQIIDIRKISGDKFNVNLEQDDIVGFARKLVADFDLMAKSKGIELIFNGPIELVVWFDKTILEKIILNMLGNAFKFTDKGHIIVGISNKLEKVVLSIEDTGIGITEKELPKIFDRFYRTQRSISGRYEGTGVGLTLVKELVDLLEGEITVDSQYGNGSRFVISLPTNLTRLPNIKASTENHETLQDGQSLKTVNPNNSINELLNEGKSVLPKKPSLLIIEDNVDMSGFIKELFSGNFQIFSANNGKTGLESAKKMMPDIVVSDVMMPEMDGIEFLRRLRDDMDISHIPVVLLTAKSLIDDQIEGIETGADAYIPKPFDERYLKAVVNNLLENRQKLRERWNPGVMSLTKEEYALGNSDHMFLEKVLAIIDGNIDNCDFKVEDIYSKIGMGHATFFKKIKYLTNLSAGDIIKTKRMERAAFLLKEHKMRVSEVCYSVGFNDPKYFYKVFKEHFGVAPSEY